MKRDNQDRYYHGGLGGAENRRKFDRDTRNGDYGPEHEFRGRYGSSRSERDFNNYRERDYRMEDEYYNSVRGEHHGLENIRQGYGYPSFEPSHNEEDDRVKQMIRERNSQPDLHSHRMEGYSGSRFGGSNYSAHGDFGGSPRYGSMSGRDRNAYGRPSSSGYGGGFEEISQSRRNSHNEPHDFRHDRNDNRSHSYYHNRNEQNW